MIKIESIKDYLNNVKQDDFINLSDKIYNLIEPLTVDYPNHKEWFYTKQLPEITTDKRNILFVRNPENQEEIISAACLKKDDEEKKICTFYVCEKYRGLGIGTLMIEKSMDWLETTKPFITFSSNKLDMFKHFIRKYNWELTEVVENFYNNNSIELCFNGSLIKKDTKKL